MSNKKQPNFKSLEAVKNQYSDRDYNININIPEFSCVCPRTGLPDFATIKIDYVPKNHIVELKSLKLYIVQFRNFGIFHEHVTNKIMDDIKKTIQPKKITVLGIFNARGGIQTTIEAYWEE